MSTGKMWWQTTSSDLWISPGTTHCGPSAQATRLTEEARSEQTLLYPQIACREALINAIVHRNYAIEGRGIEISIFSDRLEIFSPGMLLSTLSLSDLRAQTGVHESRNPLIARGLCEVALVREMGEGVRPNMRLCDRMRSQSRASKATRLDSSYRSEIDLCIRRRWTVVKNFDTYHLSEAQRGVMALGYGGREFSTQEIIDRLGIVDTDKIREVTAPLRSLGLIERTSNHMRLFREASRRRVPKREIPSYRIAASHGAFPEDGLEHSKRSRSDRRSPWSSSGPWRRRGTS